MRFFQDFIGGSQRLSSHSVLHSSQKLPCHSLSKATSYWLYPATTQHLIRLRMLLTFDAKWSSLLRRCGYHIGDFVQSMVVLEVIYNWSPPSVGVFFQDKISDEESAFSLFFSGGKHFRQWHPLVFFTGILESKREKSLLSNTDRIQYEVFLTLKSWDLEWKKNKRTEFANAAFSTKKKAPKTQVSTTQLCNFFSVKKKHCVLKLGWLRPSALLRRCSRTPWGKSQWWGFLQ